MDSLQLRASINFCNGEWHLENANLNLIEGRISEYFTLKNGDVISIDGSATEIRRGQRWSGYKIAFFSPHPCLFNNITMSVSLIIGEGKVVEEFTKAFTDHEDGKLLCNGLALLHSQ